MRIGIPKGLLYSKFHVFAETFFTEAGAEIIVSPDTNREILDAGVNCCADDACLPVKVFHGHVSWLCNKCDMVLVPRLVNLERNKYICPMFCGLCEMVKRGVPSVPPLIDDALYSLEERDVFAWAAKAARRFTRDGKRIKNAFAAAMERQKEYDPGLNQSGLPLRAAVIGHAYNIFDSFLNMDLISKLNRLGIGAVTLEHISKDDAERESGNLFKQPFWYFAGKYFGAAAHLSKNGGVDGIIYISAFSCGVDSVVVELIRGVAGDFPLLVLKIDEHTGQAGFDTRLEAFADMLARREKSGNNFSADGHVCAWGKGVV